MGRQVWVSGVNMAGYLPNRAPILSIEWNDAQHSLMLDLTDHLDYLNDMEEPDERCISEITECNEEIKRLSELTENESFIARVGIYVFCIDLFDISEIEAVPDSLTDEQFEQRIQEINEGGF